VYGTDNGAPGNFHWCSNRKEFEPKEIAWAPGEPNKQFHCVYLKKMGVNNTVLATADCETEKKFLCDVRKKGTDGMAMQQECMEIWGITPSRDFKFFYMPNSKRQYFIYLADLISLQTAGATSASYTQNLKVLFFPQKILSCNKSDDILVFSQMHGRICWHGNVFIVSMNS